MKILHVNTYDTGGAANACLRLHMGLRSLGVKSKVLLKHNTRQIEATHAYNPPEASWDKKIKNKLLRIGRELKLLSWIPHYERRAIALEKYREGLELISYPFSNTDITTSALYQEADIIHLHWVANFLDWKSFFRKNTKPVVWTLHDQNPFLGIEHYAERFQGMDSNGKPIPRVYAPQEQAEEQKMQEYKQQMLAQAKSDLLIVSPSVWMMREAQNSKLFGKYRSRHIPNGFPTNIFKPLDKNFCREVLGLPKDRKVLLFVSDSLENKRKGFAFLKAALSNGKEDDWTLCAVGRKHALTFSSSSELIELGAIHDERLMAMVYAAADVFVIPSLEDNLPNTMIESLLCGTPVIAFPTGGIVEVVQDGQNGWLCPEISVEALSSTIERAKREREKMNRLQIAAEAAKKYNLQKQAQAYIEVYEELLNKTI
ncbi:glycosyltransferase involved in cell wall biosynthesis [Thermonema lapsum]|uniref:Glycosyltransferase involved in cell wall biosynthesis n=1 Tax=Thermonema lapsum TaxID=28195 RepID=A0A846MMQ4_9BACT|nr:glycosyltransferase [Thermonema lapsum]NIK72700.1 glycosyltransferase involved in cell wall biosynthesis [Thermonema lapsum]